MKQQRGPRPATDDELRAMYSDLDDWERRAQEATAKGAQALARLLDVAATDTGQARKCAAFIGACAGYGQFEPFDLRALDVSLSDDVLALLDAVRWGKRGVETMIPEGQNRIEKMLRDWGMIGAS